MRELAAETDLAELFVAQDRVAAHSPNWHGIKKHLLRIGITFAVSALFVTLLVQRLGDLDFAATWGAVSAVGPQAWAAAMGLTGLAFWAVGHYDAVLHRHFETGVDARRARAAGISAIAVSQTLGLGVVTGAILRWRMLPDQSFWLASRLTVAVALSFLAGWAVVTALAVIVFDMGGYAGFAAAVLGAAALAIALSVIAPPAPFRWPNLFTITALLGFCTVDTLAAAGALYILLPPDMGLTIALFLPAFLLAYGAGLLSGAPAGIGAFELTLLALLPQMPEAHLIAAILGWRLAYFALPAVLGALIAMRGPRLQREIAAPVLRNGAEVPLSLLASAPAEYGLLAQGEHKVLIGKGPAAGGAWMVAPRGHVLVGLLGPAVQDTRRASLDTAIIGLMEAARHIGRAPAIYKASARTAACARARGWRSLRTAREAVLRPASFDLATPARASLRRKLRRSQGAGVAAEHLQAGNLPMAELAAISQSWAQAHGGERGFSMGRFSADYIRRQRVYVARQGGVIIAFASFHSGADEWTLDLMRSAPDLPDGAMHALIHAALADAARLGIARLSLASAPESAFASTPFARATARAARVLRLDAGHGLRRFKDAFAPDWQPRYLCAPSWPAVLIASASILRAIIYPRRLPQAAGQGAEYAPKRDNRFALPAAIWHGKGKISAN